jgi:hypothetical protein
MLEPGYSSDYLLDTKTLLSYIEGENHIRIVGVITTPLKVVNNQGQLAAAKDAFAQLPSSRHLLLATRAL